MRHLPKCLWCQLSTLQVIAWRVPCSAIEKGNLCGCCPAADLGPADAMSAVESFAKSDFRRVHNKPAFLNGIIRRVKIEGPDRTHRSSDLDRMSRDVRHKLLDLLEKVRLGPGDADGLGLYCTALLHGEWTCWRR